MDSDAIYKVARKYAIKNASDYGKAVEGPVISKLISEIPEAKGELAVVKDIVRKAIAEVNKLSSDEIKREFSEYSYAEPPKQRQGLPDLPSEWMPFVANTRFAPNPSGFLTIGHAKVAILCDEYAKKYGGKFWLRFEDTDPKTKKPMVEAYAAIAEDLKWLGCNLSGSVMQSSRMELYYKYAKKLLEEGKAYVCTCSSEEVKRNRLTGTACKCRASSTIVDWDKMLHSFGEGSAILRLKTDLNHPNSSIRDWIMFRIIDAEHPITKKKYRVWPLYNFAATIDDHDMGITLIIRGKEHEANAVKQQYLYDALGWQMPRVLEVGALRTKEFSHKSEIARAIKSGAVSGWDDPRIPTIRSIKNRGIQPAAIRRYVVESGTGKQDSILDWNKLAAFNRALS
jgi:glutamyl-tRNA synthetase